jgi:hypothetical protein
MALTFLSNDIWPRLRKLARSRGRQAVVAVPFLGTGAANRLALRRGDVLVTKFDAASVRSGLVSPHEIVKFIKRGVEVHSVVNLHAKVYVFGRTAIVASANVSASSETQLIEAGCVFDAPSVVAQCRNFVLALRGEVVELKFARSQVSFWRPPRSPYRRKPIRSRSNVIEQAPLVAVSLQELDYDESDTRAADVALHTARRRLADHNRFRVDDFRWTGDVPKVLRSGARVLMCQRSSESA